MRILNEFFPKELVEQELAEQENVGRLNLSSYDGGYCGCWSCYDGIKEDEEG